MTKSAVNCGVGHIYRRNSLWKTSFFCAVQCKRLFRSLSIIIIYDSNVFWIRWFYRFTDFTELRFVKVARIREFSGRHLSKFGRKTLLQVQSLVTEKVIIEPALRNITSGIFLFGVISRLSKLTVIGCCYCNERVCISRSGE